MGKPNINPIIFNRGANEMTPLQKSYIAIAEQYLKAFIKKQGYEFSYWVADDVGGVACFIDQYFFGFDDIRIDIDKKAKKGLIFKWQDDVVDNHEKKGNINYISYIKGLMYKDIKA